MQVLKTNLEGVVYEYEKEMDIIDMLKECLKRWWIILAMAILGAIVGGTISVYMSSSQEVAEAIVEETLSEREISLCDAYVAAKEKQDSISISEIETNEELNYYYELKKSIINDYDIFTDQQKKYVDFGKDADEIDEIEVQKILKFILLGSLVGIVDPVMAICLIYILTGTIKTENDMLLYGMNDY